MQTLTEFFYDWMFSVSDQVSLSQFLSTVITGAAILISSFILFIICRKILFSIANRIAKRTVSDWDDIFLKNKIIHGISHLIPATLIYFTANYAGLYYPNLVIYIHKVDEIYYLIAILFTINAFLSSINEIYNNSFTFSKDRPINGIIQLLKIFIYFSGFLFLVSIVFDKELTKLLTGLGAVAAILLLVFKDAILGFVASMQISMNDMVKIGDWIEMTSRSADGEVLEINLTTVKVQNWDKTITMIPTYSLISEHFINWKGMQQADGRRIKRSINIDITSIRFCDIELIERFSNFPLISEYILQKKNELEKLSGSTPPPFNSKQLTNIGIFRKYLELYLTQNPLINNDMAFIVRYLQSDNYGLPLEVYVFSKEKTWESYEDLQSTIFEHIFAVLPEFDLRIFQSSQSIAIPR